MEDERIRILKMVEEKKITPENAAKLIEAMGLKSGPDQMVGSKSKGKMKFFKIRVYEGNLEKPKVNIAIPMGLVKLAWKFLPADAKLALNEQQIDLNDILAAIDDQTQGKILEVDDAEDKQRVEIVIE